MLAFFSVVYLKSRRDLQFAMRIQDSDFLDNWLSAHKLLRPIMILQSDMIQTPIAAGIFKPRIILPKSMDLNDEQLLHYVLRHEYYHIKRFDALWKLLLVLALCVHWFNPLVWVMFVLANRDLELTCDEKVVRYFGAGTRADYAYALIHMAEKRGKFVSLYSGFSKNAAEERIESIMKMKKMTFAGIACGFLVGGTLIVNALTTPYVPYSDSDTPDVPAYGSSTEMPTTGQIEEGAVVIGVYDGVVEFREELTSSNMIEMDYETLHAWTSDQMAALRASGDYSEDVLRLFEETHERLLEAAREGHLITIACCEDATFRRITITNVDETEDLSFFVFETTEG